MNPKEKVLVIDFIAKGTRNIYTAQESKKKWL